MFEVFSHFLSYGATDQRTIRDLVDRFDGLIVPGTVAAYQKAGTGGFVLTLSAKESAVEYVIDPRFPLFQQSLRTPKMSHVALAELLGDPSLVSAGNPDPSTFTNERVERIARNWVRFNSGYSREGEAKFKKYAEKLGEDVRPQNVRLPAYILPPYAAVEDIEDPWWDVSKRLFDAARSASSQVPCVRVVAVKDVEVLESVLADVLEDGQFVIWVSPLNELEEPAHTLASYARSIRQAHRWSARTFALYGGFFSVMLSSLGLAGSAHGIGFGEYRDWIELPQSGPPPARYYLRRIHRYVGVEFATRLWLKNRALVECSCPECRGDAPVTLDYHGLMRHSVLCRSEEIHSWVGSDVRQMTARLDREYKSFMGEVVGLDLPGYIVEQATRASEHLTRWSRALKLGS